MALRVGRARGRGRGQSAANAEVLEEMKELRARMEAMELGRQRDPEAGDVSEPEEEEQGDEAVPMQETPELRYFRSILGATSRPKPELPTYEGC